MSARTTNRWFPLSSLGRSARDTRLRRGHATRPVLERFEDRTLLTGPATPLATTTTLVSDLNPSAFQAFVNFTATVTNADTKAVDVPTDGTITFFDNGAQIDSEDVVTGPGGNVVMFATPTLSVGTHPITAQYVPDPSDATYASSTSGMVSQVVNAAHTTTTLSPIDSSQQPNPSPFGLQLAFRASVTNADVPETFGNPPSGTVEFDDNGTKISSQPFTGNPPIFFAAAPAAGSHTYTATFIPATSPANFVTSTGTYVQTVNAAHTTTTLTPFDSSQQQPNPSPFGLQLAFRADVTNADVPDAFANPPSGTVEFDDNGTKIDSQPFTGSPLNFFAAAPAAGSHTYTATFTPATSPANFVTSTGTYVQTVNAAHTTTTLTPDFSQPNPSPFGRLLGFVVIVTNADVAFAFANPPTGTVELDDNGTEISSQPYTGSPLNLFAAAPAVGSHTLTATFIPATDPVNFVTSMGTYVQTVNAAHTTIALSSDTNPSTFGDQVTFTADVTNADAPGDSQPADGTVTFFDNGMQIGTGTVSSNGPATLATSSLLVGTHPITAQYAPASTDTSFLGSSTPTALTQTVATNTTTTVAAPSQQPNPSSYGRALTFTATVASNNGGGTPTGTVQFSDNGNPLGTASSLTSGTASITLPALAVGPHSISAHYNGDTTDNPSDSSNPAAQTVNAAHTTVTLSSGSPNPSTYGGAVTFTASVGNSDVPAAPPTSGTVELDDNGTRVTSQPWTGSLLTFSPTSLSVGTHSLSAKYIPDTANFVGNSSTSVSQTVKSNTKTTVSGTPNPSVLGQSVTFTAAISRTSVTGAPGDGKVQFYDNGNAIGALQSLTNGTASYTLSTLTIGSHTISASYLGDALDNSSMGSLTQAVSYATRVLGNPNTSKNGGSALPFSIAVTNSNGTNLSAPGLTVTAVGIGPAGSTAPTKTPAVSPGGTNPGGTFVYDRSLGGYTFSLKLVDPTTGKALTPGNYLLFYTIVNDPTLHTFKFTVTK